jgi:acylphosphatase
MKCWRFLVSGMVQGVFYRAATHEQAERLGVSGWVRNLPDGGVEVRACGEDKVIDALEDWLRRGPPMARVVRVERQQIPAGEPAEGFTIKY